ncbi:sodium:alanine symporter family protein [Emcibacter nanhaiensis]|uniref:Sodium:alanine symporter family protein n=2 Tax=Emcibacter nanhaiensis TaxID=1505037 RepID=A0A501PNK2_9PROT|nr:sodium:alanine symporter family protein [Emcibacter nanhaiensis]
MEVIESFFNGFSAFMWGKPLVALIVLGGLFFMTYSRFQPYKYIPHAFDILRGKYDRFGGHGDISHFQALSTALSGTLGMGNVTGVALAITIGGPGAIFWMWVTAIVGMATKFFTASLAVMYRGYDSKGHLQGGPMYVIREGLGRKWMPLAILFAIAGLVGTLPVFQINQLVQVIRDMVAIPAGLTTADNHFLFDLVAGVLLAGLVLAVISGRIQRIADVTSRLVPLMVVLYFLMTAVLLVLYAGNIPDMLLLIVSDAFSGKAAAGGAIGGVILIGVQRGAFSNEAGIGTESLAHGAAKTDYPTREGLVAMLGPVIDTLIVCTCTALAILVTGVWQGEANGISLTGSAFETAFPGLGGYLLTVMVFFLAISTVLSFWYYGSKCTGFLIGAEREHYYSWFYAALVVIGAIVSLKTVVGLIDGMYAVMAIPTMTSTLLLAPRVMERARIYFHNLDQEEAAAQVD